VVSIGQVNDSGVESHPRFVEGLLNVWVFAQIRKELEAEVRYLGLYNDQSQCHGGGND
jgi:hypothetical protein